VQVAPVAAQELEVEAPEPVWGRVEELEQAKVLAFQQVVELGYHFHLRHTLPRRQRLTSRMKALLDPFGYLAAINAFVWYPNM